MATIRRATRMDTSAPKVMLTPMIDMFTILLVFLLKSYTAADINPGQTMKLPLSVAERLPETALKVTVSKEMLLLDDQEIAPIQRGRIHSSLKNRLLIVPLYDALGVHAARRQQMIANFPELAKKLREKILIIADRDTPAALIDEIFYTISQRDFGKFHLVVEKKESKKTAASSS